MTSKIHEFTLAIPGVQELTDEMVDRLHDAGCDDGLVCHGDGELEIDFAREAESLREAVKSAIADIAKAGLKVNSAKSEEYTFLRDLNQQLAGAAS